AVPAGHAVGSALPRVGLQRASHLRARTDDRSHGRPEIRQGLEGPLMLSCLPMALLLAALGQSPSAPAAAKEPALWGKLRARIQTLDANLDGVLGVAVKDLKTGATLDLRGDQAFPTASSIKVAVLYELYRQAEDGRIDLGGTTRPPLPRVKGGGVL